MGAHRQSLSEQYRGRRHHRRAGVKVHVLLDWVGSNKMDPTHTAAMEAAGVDVRKFHKPAWYSLARINNRTHRKVLVVDGKVGFTGGVGVAGLWSGNAQDPQHWRDTHFRAEGPVVANMQAIFLYNWIKVTGAVMYGKNYFRSCRQPGKTPPRCSAVRPPAAARACI